MGGLTITNLDERKVEEGVWTSYLGVELLITRAKNKKFVRFIRKAQEEEGKSYVDLDREKRNEILKRAIAETILVGWRWERDGEEIPYTTENAYELLKNDPDCLDFVSDFSQDIQNFRRGRIEKLGES